jgi:hypothetical protein
MSYACEVAAHAGTEARYDAMPRPLQTSPARPSEGGMAQRKLKLAPLQRNRVPRKGIEPSQACSKGSEETLSQLEGAARKRHLTP